MTVRPIQKTDIPSVVALTLRNLDDVLPRYYTPEFLAKIRAVVTPEKLKSQMASKRIFVVEQDGEIVATGGLADYGSAEKPKHTVSQFYVRVDMHSRGIGKHLLAHLIDLSQREGVTRLHVPSSKNAIPFYGQAGFIEDQNQPDAAKEITWMTMQV